MDRRPLVGITATLLLILGVGFYVIPGITPSSALPAICIRIGLLLAAIWLAIPDLGKIPQWLWVNIVLTILVVAWRPRAALFVVPALFVSWAIRPRK